MPMGGAELLIILIIILLFFGAKRVPELGRSFGKSMREFRQGASEDSDKELQEAKEENEKGQLPRQEKADLKEAHTQAEDKDVRDEMRTERNP